MAASLKTVTKNLLNCFIVSFGGVLHLASLLPIELCTSYVPKFRILQVHGLLTHSENWLLCSTTSFPTSLQVSARICP